MMIATYPNFSKLSISLKKDIEEITKTFLPYSDFNFTSLFSWDIDNKTEVSLLNDNLVVRLQDYLDSSKMVTSILGRNLIDDTLKKCLEDFGELQLIPAATVEKIKNRDFFEVEESRDNFDYIYRTSDIAHFAGSEFKKKRNKSNRVEVEYGEKLITHPSEKVSLEAIKELIDVFRHWVNENHKTDDDSEAENRAIIKLLTNADFLDLVIVELRHNHQLVAFSINEKINGSFAICHFEKAVRLHEDIYPYLVNRVALELEKQGCAFLNWEQDLGLPGLRQSKSSYEPYGFLRKYTVRKRTTSP